MTNNVWEKTRLREKVVVILVIKDYFHGSIKKQPEQLKRLKQPGSFIFLRLLFRLLEKAGEKSVKSSRGRLMEIAKSLKSSRGSERQKNCKKQPSHKLIEMVNSCKKQMSKN